MNPFTRTLIIGNSGSGKSTLAHRLTAFSRAVVTDLDAVHWEGAGHGAKRDEACALAMVHDVAAGDCWIIEGVYGWLAEAAAPRATALIWLDMPWAVCRAGLLQRARAGGGDVACPHALMTWAEAYWHRQTSTSFAGHAALHRAFGGAKWRLSDRAAVETLREVAASIWPQPIVFS